MSAADLDGGEEGGDGYFASVSDLMVGILFVFLLMLTVFALNYRDEEDSQLVAKQELIKAQEDAARAQKTAAMERLKAQLEQAKNDELRTLLRQAVERLQADVEERQRLRANMLKSLKNQLDKALSVDIEIDVDSGILRLPGDLLFEKDKSELNEKQRTRVIQIAEVLGNTIPCYSAKSDSAVCVSENKPILETVLVEGHSDKQVYRYTTLEDSQDRNDRLSTDRALAVFKLLRLRPSPLDDLKSADGQPLFAVSAYGERRPVKPAEGESEADSYRRNRRIDLRFILSPRTSEEFQRLQKQIEDVLNKQ